MIKDRWKIITRIRLPPFREKRNYSPSDWRGYQHPIKGHGDFLSLESAIQTAKGLLHGALPALWVYQYRYERGRKTQVRLSRIVWHGTAVDNYGRAYNFKSVYNPYTTKKSFSETIAGYWK